MTTSKHDAPPCVVVKDNPIPSWTTSSHENQGNPNVLMVVCVFGPSVYLFIFPSVLPVLLSFLLS